MAEIHRVCNIQYPSCHDVLNYIWQKVLQKSRKHWEKEKLLVTSNFSFFHNVFKRLVLQTCKNQGLFGKGLNNVHTHTGYCSITGMFSKSHAAPLFWETVTSSNLTIFHISCNSFDSITSFVFSAICPLKIFQFS